MAAPVSAINTRGQSMDSLYATDGSEFIKLAVGSVDAGLDEFAAWQGIATHTDGGTLGTNDGVVVLAGVDVDDGVTVRRAVVDDVGRVIVAPYSTSGAFTDRSGTITAGGVSQQLAASNTARRYLLIQNLDNAEDLWINFGVAAVVGQPSIKITPYGNFIMESSFISTQQVNVIAATTAHAFTAKEG